MPSCSGLILTSFSKIDFNKNLDTLIPHEIETYNKYKILTTYPTGLKGQAWLLILPLKHFAFFYVFRFWMEKQAESCENLFWHPNIWQNHQGQSSKVCGYVISNWWHHGTSHWILYHQWSGNYLLCSQNLLEYNSEENTIFSRLDYDYNYFNLIIDMQTQTKSFLVSNFIKWDEKKIKVSNL